MSDHKEEDTGIQYILEMMSLAVVAISLLWISKSTSVTLGSSRFNKFAEFCLESQQSIIQQIEAEDRTQHKFCQDEWNKNDVAFGVTAVIQQGEVIEKGAVSTTITKGVLSHERAQAISSRKQFDANALVNSTYYAAALSLVLHSKSPMIPTFRADIRYFELENGEGWFGGGGDMTPYYLFDEDATYFHSVYKTTCDKYADSLYPRLKEWCDDYFFIPSRGEHRGVGGIFFDDLISIDGNTKNLDMAYDLTCDVCKSFMNSYLPIVRKRRDMEYNDKQRHWQLLRRGRYIEFNMLYDRGVKFGLVPGGRIEAVMVSCPPLVAWDYNHVPEKGSEEERLMKILKKPLSWV
jgi:coproporphyrinogen III oxidase